MKTLRTLSALTVLLLLLAACSTALSPNEEAVAQQAILAAVDEAFAADANDDGIDLASSAALSSQSVNPFIVIYRKNMARQREAATITIDYNSDPISAVAEVEISITGVAELWKIYPDLSAPRELVGEKAINMTGTITITAEKWRGEWHVTSVSSTAFTQGDFAATVDSWSVSPDPLLAGTDANVLTVELLEVDTSDAHLVVARGRHFRPKSVLNDNGVDPDPTADDDSYNGFLEIDSDARLGRHLGFIHALNYTKTIDLTLDGDAFLYSYTDTLLPVVVVVDYAE